MSNIMICNNKFNIMIFDIYVVHLMHTLISLRALHLLIGLGNILPYRFKLLDINPVTSDTVEHESGSGSLIAKLTNECRCSNVYEGILLKGLNGWRIREGLWELGNCGGATIDICNRRLHNCRKNIILA